MKSFQLVSRRSSGVEHTLGKVGYTPTAPQETPEFSQLFSRLMRLNAPQKGEMGLVVGQNWVSEGGMRNA